MGKKKGWGFDMKNMDTKTRPQDDFYRYANGGWIKRTNIPPTESWWGTFSIIRYKTDRQLRLLLNKLDGKSRVRRGTPQQMIRDFYRSAKDISRREELGSSPLNPYQRRIESIHSKADLLDTIAFLHRIGTGGFWGIMLEQDYKRSDRYLLYVYQEGLGMTDRDYYLKNGPEQKRIRKAYISYIEGIMRLSGKGAQEAVNIAKVVMEIETMLARLFMTKEEEREVEKTYNKMSLAQLTRLAPEIDWKRYFDLQSIPLPKEVVVMQPDFLKGISRLISRISLEDWKTYLSWHLLNDFAGSLSPAFTRQVFAFYGKALLGAKNMKPLWRRALASVNSNLGELFGQLYVEEYVDPKVKQQVKVLVDDLFAAYGKRLRELKWMSPPTRKKALSKLRAMNCKIGYPDRWKSYRGLEIKPDDYFGNLIRITEYEHRRMIKKLERPVDRDEWHMSPQSVNAYCSFNLNEVVFPAAFLQFPFFDPEADDAVNYGALGMTIGHEITHAFDDQGSKFDGRGNMKSWWTALDRKHFVAKGKRIERQFSAYTVAPGLKVNGTFTLGENIADLGGLSIAFDAYQRKLKRTDRKVINGFTPEQRFFLGFAQAKMAKERPEFTKFRVLNDCHAPVPFRANGPLSNMPEFYEAFGVKKGDKLYRPPAQRAKVW